MLDTSGDTAAGTGLSMGQAEEEGYGATSAQAGKEKVAGKGWLLCSGPWADRAGAVFTSLLCCLQTDLLARAGGLDEQVDWNW